MCVGVLLKISEENLQVLDRVRRPVMPSTAKSPASQETLLPGHAQSGLQMGLRVLVWLLQAWSVLLPEVGCLGRD